MPDPTGIFDTATISALAFHAVICSARYRFSLMSSAIARRISSRFVSERDPSFREAFRATISASCLSFWTRSSEFWAPTYVLLTRRSSLARMRPDMADSSSAILDREAAAASVHPCSRFLASDAALMNCSLISSAICRASSRSRVRPPTRTSA